MSAAAADFLLYGSYGYTGRLLAREAIGRGLRPLLAGRNRTALEAQARELDLPWRAFSLDDASALGAAVGDVPAVLHAAGPFRHTFRPMLEACLERSTHYLDVTGEADVLEAVAARDARARERGLMLLPAAGFDVVPSDCLAAHLKRRLPAATWLALAIRSVGAGVSRGTATTMAENVGRGGLVRRDGVLRRVPTAWKTREIDFGDGPRLAVTIPWGDVVTAYYSTGIGNIEVYAAVPPGAVRAMRLTRIVGPVLSLGIVQRILKERIRRKVTGPTPEQRRSAEARVWGEVRDEQGRSAVSLLRTPEGYTLTARAAVTILERVLSGQAPPGFHTPATAYGPDFVLELEGVLREDIEPPSG